MDSGRRKKVAERRSGFDCAVVHRPQRAYSCRVSASVHILHTTRDAVHERPTPPGKPQGRNQTSHGRGLDGAEGKGRPSELQETGNAERDHRHGDEGNSDRRVAIDLSRGGLQVVTFGRLGMEA